MTSIALSPNHLTSDDSYSIIQSFSQPTLCKSGQLLSPIGDCAYPYTGTLVFRTPSFSNLGNSSDYVLLEQSMMDLFQGYGLPLDSVSLSNPTKTVDSYLVFNLQIFPSGQDRFNRTGVFAIGFVLSNQIYKPPPMFGPCYFIGDDYQFYEGGATGSHKSPGAGVVIGAAVVGSLLLLLLLLSGVYVFRQKKRAKLDFVKNNPFASWDPNSRSGGVPQLKGVKCFSFEELNKYSNNCSEINEIGAGGYGKLNTNIDAMADPFDCVFGLPVAINEIHQPDASNKSRRRHTRSQRRSHRRHSKRHQEMYVFGITHVPQLEGWPVMLVEHIGSLVQVQANYCKFSFQAQGGLQCWLEFGCVAPEVVLLLLCSSCSSLTLF